MINKIVAIQGNHPSKLNPLTDTSVFLANEIQNKKYKIFYYDPKDLSVINSKVTAKGFFIKFNYSKKKFYKILKKENLDLTKCKFILIRQDPPFNLEYISGRKYIFKDFMEGKIQEIGNRLPGEADLTTHLSTIFTENRVKKYIELRSMDTCGWDCLDRKSVV